MRLETRKWWGGPGVTLVETVITVAVFSVLIGMALSGVRVGTEAYRVGSVDGDVQNACRRALDELALELVDGVASSIQETGGLLTAPSSSPTLTFRKCEGYDRENEEIVLGDLVRLAREEGRAAIRRKFGVSGEWAKFLADGIAESLEGETAGNGLDDNGNGLIDEAGLCFTLTDCKLTIYLTVERANAKGDLRQATLSTTVRLRNK